MGFLAKWKMQTKVSAVVKEGIGAAGPVLYTI